MRSTRCSEPGAKEKAAFEAGIKISSLFHQYLGAPVNSGNVEILERAMEEGVKRQPYVASARVSLDRDLIEASVSSFGYCSLDQRMISAEVAVEVEGEVAVGTISWESGMRYPLMRLKEVEGKI